MIRSKLRELLDFVKHNHFEVAIVLLFLTTALIVRVQGIEKGMWQDEAYTIVNYINQGMGEIVAGDGYKPNNHMLFSAFSWLTTSMFGFSEVLLRAPAIVATVAAFFVMYITARKYYGKKVGLTALAIISLGSFHVFSTSTARGYGFLLLFASLFLYFTLQYISVFKLNSEKNTKSANKSLMLATVFGFLGIYTYPSFAILVAATFLTVLALSKRKEVLIAGLIGGGAVAIAILPLLAGFKKYYVDFGGGFQKHQIIGWQSVFDLPVTKIAATLENISGPLIKIIDQYGGRIDATAIVMLTIVFATAVGIFWAWKQNAKVLYILLLPSVFLLVMGAIFSIPLGSRSDYTIFLEYNFILLFSIGLVGTFQYTHKFISTRSALWYRLFALFAVLALLGVSVLFVRSPMLDAKENRYEADFAKASLNYAQDYCQGSTDCTILVYAKSTSYTLYESMIKANYISVSDAVELSYALDRATGQTVLVDEVYKRQAIECADVGLQKIKTFSNPGQARNVNICAKVYLQDKQ